MPTAIDPAVVKIRVKDEDLARVQDNLATAIQQCVDCLTAEPFAPPKNIAQYDQQGRVIKKAKPGAISAVGATFSANVVVRGSCTAQGFVSTGTGFRRSYQMGTYWSNGTMATTDTALQRPITTGNTAYAGMNAAETMAIPGSVISLTGYANGSPGGTWTMTLYKNNVATGLTASSTTQTLRVNAQKNAFTFNNDDFLTVCIKGSSSTMQQAFSASIEVEGYA